MKFTKIIIELEYDNPHDVMKLRKSIQSLLDSEEYNKSYSIYQEE